MTAFNAPKNPNPQFTPRSDKTLAFNAKAKEKAAGFTASEKLSNVIALARGKGAYCRTPRENYLPVLEAFVQGALHHYDLLADRCAATMHRIADECGLMTQSAAGNVSISRATNAAERLAEIGLAEYHTEFNSTVGCNFPSDFSFTPLFWQIIDMEEAHEKAVESKAAYENKRRARNGEQLFDVLGWLREMRARAKARFHQYRLERKAKGEARRRAQRESELQRSEIAARVRAEVQADVIAGRFPSDYELVQREIKRRTDERTIASRRYTQRPATV